MKKRLRLYLVHALSWQCTWLYIHSTCTWIYNAITNNNKFPYFTDWQIYFSADWELHIFFIPIKVVQQYGRICWFGWSCWSFPIVAWYHVCHGMIASSSIWKAMICLMDSSLIWKGELQHDELQHTPQQQLDQDLDHQGPMLEKIWMMSIDIWTTSIKCQWGG